MSETTCPNCGFTQEGGEECLRCGIIFAKFRPRPEKLIPKPDQPKLPFRTRLFRFLKVARWIGLCLSLVIIILILLPDSRPVANYSRTDLRQASSKVRLFQKSTVQGRARHLELTQSELNAWLNENLALTQNPDAVLQQEVPPELAQTASSVKDFQVTLVEDRIRTFIRFDLYGKEMTFILEAKPSVRNGYLHLSPVSGKIGSMPIPAAVLKRAIDRQLNKPEEKRKLKLPENIRDILVVAGKLRVEAIPLEFH